MTNLENIVLSKRRQTQKAHVRGPWVAQLVKHPILDFDSGHNLMVHEIDPHVGLCADSVESAWDSLPLPLSLSALLLLTLSQNE